MKPIGGVALSQQANGEGWDTLKFRDHSDISHSLRKTILQAGKQISLMNYCHQLTKYNNVSLET